MPTSTSQIVLTRGRCSGALGQCDLTGDMLDALSHQRALQIHVPVSGREHRCEAELQVELSKRVSVTDRVVAGVKIFEVFRHMYYCIFLKLKIVF